MSKYTGWFNGAQKPVREGVYQRELASGLCMYSRWCGSYWTYHSHTVEDAARETNKSSIQCSPWRGLAKEPK